MKICIIQAGTSDFSGSFIKAHQEFIIGEKVILSGPAHDLKHNGRSIKFFYSKRPWLQKLKKLLPQWIYHQKVTLWQRSFSGKLDALAGFFETHKVDVILAEFGNQGAEITPYAKHLGIPLIVHFHGGDVHRLPYLVDFKEKYLDMFDYAHKIISVSHFMTDALITLGAPVNKIVYNPYGPRKEFYNNTPNYTSDFILNIGRFTDIKAPNLLILAFKDMLLECPNAKLVMIGMAELLESCKAMVKALNIEDNVLFTGGIPHAQLMPYFQNSCMFIQHSVQPSYGDAEGTPNTILEASAAGLPVVSTLHAGIVDAVIHEKTGLLGEEYDIETMTKNMITLFKDRSLCEKYGKAGRTYIKINYNIDRHISILDNVILSARNSQTA